MHLSSRPPTHLPRLLSHTPRITSTSIKLQVIVTPPRPGTAESNLTPSSWLLSDQVTNVLWNKHLEIHQEEQTSLSLDPAHLPSDHSITTYHKRISQMLPNDREKLAVMMPRNDWMERIQEGLEARAHDDRLKFKIYTSDLMINFAEKLEAMLGKKGIQVAEKGENDPAHDRKSKMSRSKTILDNISAQVFTQRTGLPSSYRKTIAAFEDIVEERNKVCHETGFEFARLLLTKQFKDPVVAQKFNCPHWSALLLWVTGYATLEEMAAVANVVTPPPIE